MPEGLLAEPETPQRRYQPRRWYIAQRAAAAVLLAACAAYLVYANRLPPPPARAEFAQPPDRLRIPLAAVAELAEACPVNEYLHAPELQLRSAVVAARNAAPRLRSAFAAPDTRRGTLDPPVEARLNLETRAACWTLCAAAYSLRRQGQPGSAAGFALDALELASRSSFWAGRQGYESASRCAGYAVRELLPCLSSLTPVEILDAQARLGRALAQLPSYSALLADNRTETLLLFRRMVADPHSQASIWFGLDAAQSALATPAAGLITFVYPKQPAYAALSEYLDAVAAGSETPYVERKPVPPPRDPLLRGASMAERELPGAPSLSFVSARQEARLRLLYLDVAIRKFRETRGRLPLNLAELHARGPRQNETDPFDGKPLRYRRAGASYLLYSVGPDGRDDGGASPTGRRLNEHVRGDLLALDPR